MKVFEDQLHARTAQLQRVQWWDNLISKLSFGLLGLSFRLEKAISARDHALSEYNAYIEKKEKCTDIIARIAKNQISGSTVTSAPPQLGIDAGGEDYGADWEDIARVIRSRDNHTCTESSEKCEGVLQVHHIVPLSKGGTNRPENLITLCKYHHRLKHPHMKRG